MFVAGGEGEGCGFVSPMYLSLSSWRQRKRFQDPWNDLIYQSIDFPILPLACFLLFVPITLRTGKEIFTPSRCCWSTASLTTSWSWWDMRGGGFHYVCSQGLMGVAVQWYPKGPHVLHPASDSQLLRWWPHAILQTLTFLCPPSEHFLRRDAFQGVLSQH